MTNPDLDALRAGVAVARRDYAEFFLVDGVAYHAATVLALLPRLAQAEPAPLHGHVASRQPAVFHTAFGEAEADVATLTAERDAAVQLAEDAMVETTRVHLQLLAAVQRTEVAETEVARLREACTVLAKDFKDFKRAHPMLTAAALRDLREVLGDDKRTNFLRGTSMRAHSMWLRLEAKGLVEHNRARGAWWWRITPAGRAAVAD